MKKKIVYLTAGHTINDNGHGSGCKMNGYDEAVLARKLVNDIANKLYNKHDIFSITDPDKLSLSSVLRWFNNEVNKRLNGNFKDRLLIDFHFNCFYKESARGVEIFVKDKYADTLQGRREFNLAHDLAKTISKILDSPLRGNMGGVKSEDESQHPRLAILSNWRVQSSVNVLVETCFLTNNKDMRNYFQNYDLLVEGIANVIANHYID